MKLHPFGTVMVCAVVLAYGLTSCVKEDYDLNKDIDLTVTVGGQISIPVGSTEPFELKKLLKLDDTENVDTVSAKSSSDYLSEMEIGDYYFYSNSTDDKNSFKMNPVSITLEASNKFESGDIQFVNPNTDGSYESNINNLSVNLKFENKAITKEIVSLSHLDSEDLLVRIKITYDGTNLPDELALQKGVTINMPEGVVMESYGMFDVDAAKPNVARLNNALAVTKNSSKEAVLKVKRVNCPNAILAPGHFLFEANNVTIKGNVVIANTHAGNIKILQTKLNVCAEIVPTTFGISSACGVFEPNNIGNRGFNINEIPSMLKEETTKIYITRPYINFSVVNDESASFESVKLFNTVITSQYDAESHIADYNVTFPNIDLVNAQGANMLKMNSTDFPELPMIINGRGKIPSHVEIAVDKVRVAGTIKPDKDYFIQYDFHAPLAFEPNTQLVYTDTISNINDDLDGIKHVPGVTMKAKALNTMPMQMEIQNVAFVDTKGNYITDLECTDFKDVLIAAGNAGTASESEITLNIVCKNDDAISRLDGIELTFNASIPAEGRDITLNNQKHRLSFKGIKLQLNNGITIDLDDI